MFSSSSHRMFGVSVFMKEELTSTDARKDARLWVGCMHGSQLAFDVSRAFCTRATDGHASSCSSGASATTPSILSAASRSLPNRLRSVLDTFLARFASAPCSDSKYDVGL